MARINLRDYLREIDDLIDNGRTDEAIAHSRYILELYPKNIETYRLLGKAYLETQRYSDAADVLQRVLSSIPDDFISQLGMSIIREDEGNFEAAIWHMERAFEVQPSNAAIQGELRRLYGRRDGLEPTKIHLTRGALARMYAKGDLYEQAIAEIRATLSQEPQRTDLKVLLARMYVQNGQHVEAAKICSNILQGYPNCKEANQILGEILSETDRADESVNYHRRLQAMDPYAAHTSPSTPSSEHVPDNVITLERHEWTPGDTGGAKESRPDWAASLGVEIGTSSTEDEPLPDWLADPTSDDQTPAFTSESIDTESLASTDAQEELLTADSQDDDSIQVPPEISPEDEFPDQTDEIPDWMQSAGWELADQSSEKTPSPFTLDDESEEIDDEIDDEIAPAQIPDWLQSMSPLSTDPDTSAPETIEDSPEGEPVTWLEEKKPGATDSIVTWLQTKNQLEQEDNAGIEAVIETDSDAIEEPLSDEVKDVDEEQTLDEGIPDWLRDLGDETIPETTQEQLGDLDTQTPELIQESLDESTGTEDIAEWHEDISDKTPSEESLVAEFDQVFESPDETEPTADEDMPDWLSELSDEMPIEQIQEQAEELEVDAEDSLQPDEAEPTDEEDMPEWLLALTEETPLEDSEEPISDFKVTTPERMGQTELEAMVGEDAPEWQQALGKEAETEEIPEPSLSKTGETIMEDQEKIPELSSEDEDAALAWLESLAAQQGVDEEELLTSPSERQSAPPDWVQQLAAESEPLEEDVESVPDGVMQAETDEAEELGLSYEPDVVSEAESEPISEPVEEPEGIPDWLQDLVEDTSVEEGESVSPLPVADLPPADAEVESTEDILSEWLQDLADESTAAPTEPAFEEPPTLTDDTQPTRVTEEVSDLSESLDSDLEAVPDIEPSIIDTEIASFETTPDERPDEVTLQPVDEAETIPVLDRDLPAWLKDSEITDTVEPTIQGIGEEEPEIPAWITAEETVEEPGETPETAQMLEAEEVEEEAEIPAWITAEETTEEPVETPETAQMLEAEEVEEEAEIPTWITAEEMVEEPVETPEPARVPEAEEVAEEPEIPEWITTEEVVEESVETPEPTQLPEAEEVEEEPEIPEWITAEEAAADTIEASQPSPMLEAEEVEEEPEIPEWITSDEVAADTIEAPQPTPVLEAEEVEEELEIPEWIIADETVEQVSEAFDEPEPILTVETEIPEDQIEETLIEELVEEELPSPVNINTASFKALERLPGIGPVIAQTIIDHRATHGNFKDVDSIQDVPGIGPKTLNILRDYLIVEYTEEPTPLPVSPEDKKLSEGRRALEAGNISEAYEQYSELIEEEQSLDRVIDDLKEAQYRYPVEVSIYELLGDAYLRTDQIQEAIDTYTKAEELLA